MWAVGRPALGGSRSGLALLKRSQFRGTAILAVGPTGILPADKCAKATGKMPIFPTAKMAVPRRLARFSTKLSGFQPRKLSGDGSRVYTSVPARGIS